MSYRQEMDEFEAKYSVKITEASGAEFHYVLEGEENPQTLIFLNGGMNVSQMWMRYVDNLAGEFRVLLFDYPYEAKTNGQLIDALDAFLNKLNIKKPVFVGASDGGMIAQLYTQKYPQNVGGLVLIATGPLDEQSLKELKKKYFFAPLLLWYMKHCDYEKLKPKLIKAGVGYAKDESEENKAYTKDMFTELMKGYTREKDMHITGLLADILNQTPVTQDTFACLSGKIMLILPDHDFFPEKMQKKLVSLMHDPEIKYIPGGHISTVLKADEYSGQIRSFTRKIS